MVWECLANEELTEQKFELIPTLVDLILYLDILKIIESIMILGIDDDYIFQEDNDPKHTNVKIC